MGQDKLDPQRMDGQQKIGTVSGGPKRVDEMDRQVFQDNKSKAGARRENLSSGPMRRKLQKGLWDEKKR